MGLKKCFKKPISSKTRVIITSILYLLLVLFVVGTVIPWESLINKFTAFTDFNTWLGKLKIGDYAVFSNIIAAPVVVDSATMQTTGVLNAIGSWTITDIAILLFILTGIVALVARVKVDEFIPTITTAIKKVLPIAITAMLISIVLVIMVTSGVNITIANAILKLTKGFNVATSILASIVGSIFTADFYYFVSTIGSVFTANITNKDYYGIIAFIVQSIYNLMMLVAPTSVGLVIGLYYLDIPYNKWLKYIWKVLVTILVIIVIASIIIYLSI